MKFSMLAHRAVFSVATVTFAAGMAKGSYSTDFESFDPTNPSSVSSVFGALPAPTTGTSPQGNDSGGSGPSFTLAGNSSNHYGQLSATVGGAGSTQFRYIIGPINDPQASLTDYGDLTSGSGVSVSTQVLSRADTSSAISTATPYVQLGLTPGNGSAEETDVVYDEISNTGATADINFYSTSTNGTKNIAFPNATTSASRTVSIPGGFANGDTLGLSIIDTPDGAGTNATVNLIYNGSDLLTLGAEINEATGSPYAGGVGTTLEPFVSEVRGYGSGGVTAGDLITTDIDNFSAQVIPVPEPMSVGVLGGMAAIGLSRRRWLRD